ncbi:hypothetical protein RRG08_039898 [Elysia crispata]|uniref:Sodium-coupled monocarboxylate transporter 1 n=1 Tax=Elysia crispata TaxID=231223 RepID=A0AAE1DMZ3_9GAST|nr:hypothetical protein RRG08_039898 [Elysia crispata]
MIRFTAPVFFITVTIATYEGIIAFSYFQTKGCDPIRSGQISEPNQLIPFTVMDMFHNYPGLSGLFLASLFSASLSTLSSGLSSTAALSWTDVIHPLIGDLSESKSTVIIKISVVIFGCIACGVSFMVAEIGGTLTQIANSLISAFAAPLTGIFFLGCFFPRCNAKGAIVGGLCGVVFCFWISLGQSFSPNLPSPVPLEFASTDKCYARSLTTNRTVSDILGNANITTTASLMYLNRTSASLPPPTKGPSGVELLYTVSYAWISAIGVITTVVIGNIVSCVTGMNRPGDVNPRYLLSASEALLFFVPRRVRRWISSLGPQYMADEYKEKYNSDSKDEIEKVSVVTVTPSSARNGRSQDIPHTRFDDNPKHVDGVDNGGFSRL